MPHWKEQHLVLANHVFKTQSPPLHLYRDLDDHLCQREMDCINKRLNVFQQHCLHRNLKIRYFDHISKYFEGEVRSYFMLL